MLYELWICLRTSFDNEIPQLHNVTFYKTLSEFEGWADGYLDNLSNQTTYYEIVDYDLSCLGGDDNPIDPPFLPPYGLKPF